jgi:16S rRNA (uracil1498-N3)-methyltransferase
LQLFYAPGIAGDIHTLDEEESRHCSRVLRLGRGDIIYLTDGRGSLFEAEIISTGKACQVRITGTRQSTDSQRPYRLHIAIAPTKNIDRFEWFLEKATEIGIDEITPLICEHSERRQMRLDRLEKVITSAMKQSLKFWHPVLHEPVDFSKFTGNKIDGDKFIAFITEGAPLLQHISKKGNDTTILIGPEGDFSPAEVEMAKIAGYSVVSLGNSRLRTETAGIVACHTICLMNTT